ncbi:MAG: substrate-binding domain-containing protein, partial [Ruminococcus bromii]|nr:substrate-binding domain-containing protein [Ruminococcus bromii]
MKKIIALFLALIMVFSLVACTSGAETTTETKTPAETTGSTETTSTEAPAETEAKGGYTVAMLPKFKGENYFDGCYKGAQQAADDLGITLVYDGPNQSEATNAKQVEILEGFIAAGVDCIVVSPCDAEGIVPTLQKAKDNGIKVITFDADAPADAREFYVNAATAADIGKGLVDAAVKDLEAKGVAGEPCRVALISGSGLDTNQNEWILAIEAYMAENFPWMTVNCDETGYLGGDIWTPGSDETAAQNAANEAVALSGNATDGSQINVVIGTSSMSTPALAAAWNNIVGEKPDVVL